MPIHEKRRAWYKERDLDLPHRPLKVKGRRSRLVRVIVSDEVHAWLLSLEAQERGDILERARSARSES